MRANILATDSRCFHPNESVFTARSRTAPRPKRSRRRFTRAPRRHSLSADADSVRLPLQPSRQKVGSRGSGARRPQIPHSRSGYSRVRSASGVRRCGPARPPMQPREMQTEGCLARPRWPDDSHTFSCPDLQGDVFQKRRVRPGEPESPTFRCGSGVDPQQASDLQVPMRAQMSNARPAATAFRAIDVTARIPNSAWVTFVHRSPSTSTRRSVSATVLRNPPTMADTKTRPRGKRGTEKTLRRVTFLESGPERSLSGPGSIAPGYAKMANVAQPAWYAVSTPYLDPQ